jgi:hypothetical protein
LNWLSAFRAIYFAEWKRSGLPEYPASRIAGAAWPALACPLLVDRLPSDGTGFARGLDPAIVDNVYGFGVHVGDAFGRLHGVPPRARRGRAEWCGQFNLGISLFDLVCDEGGASELAELHALPSMRLFTGAVAPSEPHSRTLRLLDEVATSVLARLSADAGPPHPRRGLWRALFAMFKAQLERAAATTTRLGDADRLRGNLRLSAAEPFRMMSEWVARGADSDLRKAAHLGRCVGDCYWLIDDARDVWSDLYARRWNLFLVEAKVADPSLRLNSPTPFVEARLTQLWHDRRVAERAARAAVGRLARSLHGYARTREPVAQLHASMMQWSR